MYDVAEQINETLEELWFIIEQKERTYTHFNLSNQQYTILTLIIRTQGCSPTELADKMGITKSAISQQLTKLEADHFIKKIQSPGDKRSFIIALADNGLRYEREMAHFKQQIAAKYKEHLSEEELEGMLRSFQKLQRLLEDTSL